MVGAGFSLRLKTSITLRTLSQAEACGYQTINKTKTKNMSTTPLARQAS
jgi:hypothetical protein